MQYYGKARETAGEILRAFQTPETLPKALAPIFIHRRDDSPCRKWSWRNQLLTALAGTSDARGYRQWQAVDRHVKKGAKAFHILSPCVKKTGQTDEKGDPIVRCFGFRATAVFRVEDTDGEPLDTGNPELDKWIADLPLRDVAEHWGLAVHTYNGEPGRAHGYYRHAESIALGVQNVEVFLHELVHAAEYRLGNAVERGQHWRKETVAEFGAAVLAECLGIDHAKDFGGAYRYIEAYAKAAEKTPESACMDALDRICQAVALILDTAETLNAERVAV
jgi:hypothetical protein